MTISIDFNSKQSGLYTLGVSSVEIQHGTWQAWYLLLDLCDLLRIIVLCTVSRE